MKTLESVFLSLAVILFMCSFSLAASPVKTVKIFAPVYKAVTDCDITYYRTKINGEDVLIDSRGRFVKYICDDEGEYGEVKTSVIYKMIMVPVSLFKESK